ncbi:hypothetical protein FRC03_001001 [Tulasnella sp. 419]|nr:hypothetical protein FRC03_001001 [Tulasnella sp. 419]
MEGVRKLDTSLASDSRGCHYDVDKVPQAEHTDWNRVLYYASFVRILRGTEWTHLFMTITNPEVEFLERFGNTFPDSFLFPGLLQLEGLKLKNKAAAVLLSPSLLQIRVEIPADTSSDCAFLLFQKIQDMEHIEGLSLGSQVQLPPDLLPPLRSQGMPSLVELMLPKSTTYHQLAIVHSAAPHIQRLFIHANSISTSEKGTLRFSHLKQLDLHGSIPGCIHVLRDLEVHPAEVLSIERTGEPEGEWRQLFAAIGEMPSSDLWYIDVRISEETPHSRDYKFSSFALVVKSFS